MTPWKEKRIIGNAELYLGDCLEILPHLPKVDAVIADPPYGVGEDYISHLDTKENVLRNSRELVRLGLELAPLVSITPGNGSQHLYPPPTWTLCWFNRAGAGRCSWGFSCWQPILVYGPDPYLKAGKGARGDYIEHNEIADTLYDHPCPKPRRFMEQWITRVAFDRYVILDPFMGSGTTGEACYKIGKAFVGIEIEPKYFEIACERIENAQRQIRLFA